MTVGAGERAPRRHRELNFKTQHLHPGRREGRRAAGRPRGWRERPQAAARPGGLQGPFRPGDSGRGREGSRGQAAEPFPPRQACLGPSTPTPRRDGRARRPEGRGGPRQSEKEQHPRCSGAQRPSASTRHAGLPRPGLHTGTPWPFPVPLYPRPSAARLPGGARPRGPARAGAGSEPARQPAPLPLGSQLIGQAGRPPRP